ALMAEIVPVKTMLALAVPLPVVKFNPPVPWRVSVPWVTLRLTWTAAVPASGSAIEMGSPALLEKNRAVFSLTQQGAGTVFTGGWFGGRTVMFTVAVLEILPLPSLAL